jgi:uncharacterized glyoxalase superfamily protein PhnB
MTPSRAPAAIDWLRQVFGFEAWAHMRRDSEMAGIPAKAAA